MIFAECYYDSDLVHTTANRLQSKNIDKVSNEVWNQYFGKRRTNVSG